MFLFLIFMEKSQQRQPNLLRKKNIFGFKNKFQELIRDAINQKENIPKEFFPQSTQQFKRLTKKISNGQELKAGSRGFHKSLYKKLANRIQEKPLSFYLYGLKVQEKKTCKRVFNEIFDVPKKKLGGTLSVTDLWSNATSIRYLKENQMFCNKQVILKEFKKLGKDAQFKRKQKKQKKEKQEIQRYKELLKKQNEQKKHFDSMHEFKPQQTCSRIKNELQKISQSTKNTRGVSQGRKLMKNLEVNLDNLDDLERKYKKKMVILL